MAASDSQLVMIYLDRYKEEFATELFRWYIQNGQLRTMFEHDSVHLDQFFISHPHKLISWINDIGKDRYEEAAKTLISEAEHAGNMEIKHLVLSIGKLSHLAQIHEAQTADDTVLDAFHDGLDLVSVHEVLLAEFRSALETVRGRQPLDHQIEVIMNSKALGLKDRRAHGQILRVLVRDILQGKALMVEDVVDVLTLKDNQLSPEDFVTALQISCRTQSLPAARQTSAFRTIWRRIYLHDNWNAIRRATDVSDSEMCNRFRQTALYTALRAILSREHRSPGYEMIPDEALLVPSGKEIATRWPGLSVEEVEDLIRDYEMERDKLGEMDLSDVYHRVRLMATQDSNGNPNNSIGPVL